jgi:hypothetical protein
MAQDTDVIAANHNAYCIGETFRKMQNFMFRAMTVHPQPVRIGEQIKLTFNPEDVHPGMPDSEIQAQMHKIAAGFKAAGLEVQGLDTKRWVDDPFGDGGVHRCC